MAINRYELELHSVVAASLQRRSRTRASRSERRAVRSVGLCAVEAEASAALAKRVLGLIADMTIAETEAMLAAPQGVGRFSAVVDEYTAHALQMIRQAGR